MNYWTKWDPTNKKWEISTDGVSWSDLVENSTHEKTIFNGISAPSGIASKGVLYFDSTANKFKVKENNGAAYDIAPPLTTKGDLLSFDTGLNRLGVGSNGLILTADSAQSLGLKWGSGPLTTKGDLIVYGSAIDRLGVGSYLQHLVPDSGQSLGLKWFTPPFCKLQSNSSQNISTGTITTVQFASEINDNANMHDNVTNNTRITVPVAGKYQVNAFVLFNAQAGGARIIGLYKNGATCGLGNRMLGSSNSNSNGLVVADTVECAANDYLEVWVYQDSGVTVSLYNSYAFFSAIWLGD